MEGRESGTVMEGRMDPSKHVVVDVAHIIACRNRK